MTELLLVDDHKLLAEVLAAGLRRCGHDVSIALSVADAWSHLDGRDDLPEIAVVDLELESDGPGGVDLIEPLTARGIRVLVLSGVRDELVWAECLALGAYGFLQKSADFDSVVAAIDGCVNGTNVSPPDSERARLGVALAQHKREVERALEPFEALSQREKEVLALIIGGHSAAEISSRSYVSLSTVRSQIKSIHRKLGVTSQLQAVAMARESGWYDSRAS